jgi:hypothetical protein
MDEPSQLVEIPLQSGRGEEPGGKPGSRIPAGRADSIDTQPSSGDVDGPVTGPHRHVSAKAKEPLTPGPG